MDSQKSDQPSPNFKLSEEGLQFVQKEMKRYETRRSALLPCLYRVQKENGGWVPPEAVSHLSQVMSIPESQIHEVLNFYTLYNKKPVGRLHIQVCCNLSCTMNGAGEVVRHLCEHFKTRPGAKSPSGEVTISEVECLGACDKAPVAQVGDRYMGPLHKDTVIKQLKELKSRSPGEEGSD